MKHNLLKLVTIILSAMDSDEVDSYSDTVESSQVALLLQSLYYDMATELGLPEHEDMFQLDPSGDNTLPVLMTVPEMVTRVHTISYNKQESGDTFPNWQPLDFMPMPEFIRFTQARREQTANVAGMTVTRDGEDFVFVHATDRHPSFFTSFDDNTFIFDSYDSSLDTTLQSSKTLCQGSLYSAFILDDGFIPDLDPTQFSYFINRAKVRAFAELKQTQHAEAASESRNQKIRIQRQKRKTPDLHPIKRGPNYGRK